MGTFFGVRGMKVKAIKTIPIELVDDIDQLECVVARALEEFYDNRKVTEENIKHVKARFRELIKNYEWWIGKE